MEQILEIILSILGELIPQLFIELLAEFGIRKLIHNSENKGEPNKFFSLLGYIALAVCLGVISIPIKPNLFIKDSKLQLLNLFLSPILVGLVMGMRGKKLRSQDKKVIRLDSFFYGFMFAFTFSLIRYFYHRL